MPAEAIKAGLETDDNMLYSLFSKIWEKGEVPAQWKEGIIIKLPNKGDLRDRSIYRWIMLLSTPDKVLNRVLLSTPSSETSRKASGGTHLVPTRSPACGSSWNSHQSGPPPPPPTHFPLHQLHRL